MSACMTAQLVADALLMAVWRRGKPDSLMDHSDRGSQDASEQFQRMMADSGIVFNMSRSGNVWIINDEELLLFDEDRAHRAKNQVRG
jgi:putative transposase